MKPMSIKEMLELVNKSEAEQLKKIPDIFVQILPKQVQKAIEEKVNK